MNIASRRAICSRILAGMFLVVPGRVSGDHPHPDPDGFLAEFRSAASRIESNDAQLSIEWSQQFAPVRGGEKEALNKLNLDGRDEFFTPESCRFAWNRGKALLVTKRTVAEGFEEVKETAFDGNVFYQGTKRSAGTFLQRTSIAIAIERGLNTRPLVPHCLSYIGYSIPKSYEEWKQPYFTPSPLHRLENGAQLHSVLLTTVDGIDAVTVVVEDDNPERLNEAASHVLLDELEGTKDPPDRKAELRAAIIARVNLPEKRLFSYVMDPVRNFAILRSEERYAPSTILMRSVCDDFVALPRAGIWLPRLCDVELFEIGVVPGVSGEPALVRAFQVTQLSDDEMGDGDFVLNYDAPGTEILDITGDPATFTEPLGTRYRVPGAIEDFDRAADGARRPRSYTFLIVNLCVIVAIVAFVVIRRWR